MVIACPDCGTVQALPELRSGGSSHCWRCHGTLERVTGRSLDAALACGSATLLLLFPANLLPLLGISVLGATRQSFLGSGAVVMWQEGWVLLAIIVALQGVLLPFVRFALLTAALSALRLGRRDRWIGPVFRWSEEIDLWAMPDVYLIGCAAGYSRVLNLLPVTIGAGGWCLIGAGLLAMLTRATLDRRGTWRLIRTPETVPKGPTVACTACDMVLPAAREGGRCPRCRARLWRRKPLSMMRAVALVIAGYLLYPVANLFPMSVQLQLGTVQNHTIYSGVLQLVEAHLWPLAILIFTASIGIPLLKLAGLTWFFLSVQQGSRRALVFKTRLYRVIDAIGRWSNIDIFTIAVFLPLLQFGQLTAVRAATGASAFLAVVVVTMLASRVFDPRLLWDAAEEER